MPSQSLEIVNKLGLHARAAAKLTQVAGGFHSEIWISRSGRRVNAKSIMGVMMLAAETGSTIRVRAEHSPREWRISVEDQGPGISEENRRRVFEPARQAKVEVVPDVREGGLDGNLRQDFDRCLWRSGRQIGRFRNLGRTFRLTAP